MALLCFSQQKIQVLSLYDIHVQNRRAQYLNDSQAQMAIRANMKVCILFCLWKHCAVSVIQKEEHGEKGYWGESLRTHRQQWREKKGGSGSENAAVSSLCSVFAPPCLLCCFFASSLCCWSVWHTHRNRETMYSYAEIFLAVFVLRLSKKRPFRPSAQTNVRRTLHDVSCWDKNVFCSEENVDHRLCPSVHFLPLLRSAWRAFCRSFPPAFLPTLKKICCFLKNIYIYLYLWTCATLIPHSETCSPLASSSGT